MRGGPRKGFGGPQPNSGRKPNAVPTERHVIRVTAPQWAEFQALDGSPWLQGILNLLRADQPGAFALLLIDTLVKKHGRGWLVELAEKINERVKNG